MSMPGLETIGRLLVFAGLALVLVGGLLWLAARLFPNISQLPGTIRFQSGGLTCIFPILASIILSIILSVLLNLAARFLNK
jgi:hypothetical protein